MLRSRVEGVAKRCAAGVEVEHGGLRTLLKAQAAGRIPGNRTRQQQGESKQQACFAMRTICAGADGGVEEGGVPPVVVRWGTVISDGDVLAVLVVVVVVVF